MKVQYDIKVVPSTYRPLEEVLPFSIKTDLDISVSRGSSYLAVGGTLFSDNKTKPIANYLTLGTDYTPFVTDRKIEVFEHSYNSARTATTLPSSVALSLAGVNVSSPLFSKYSSYLKLATKKGTDTFLIPYILKKNTDAVFFKINNNVLEKVEISNTLANSGTVVTTQPTDHLYYLLVGSYDAFRLDANAPFILQDKDLPHTPSGFCSIQYNSPTPVLEFKSIEDKTVLYTSESVVLTSPTYVRLDGVDSVLYTTATSEHVVVRASDSLNELRHLTLADVSNGDNAHILYYLEDDNTLSFELLVLGTFLATGTSYVSNASVQDYLDMDDEFKKRYFFSVYKTPLYKDNIKITDVLNTNLLLDVLEESVTTYQSKVEVL